VIAAIRPRRPASRTAQLLVLAVLATLVAAVSSPAAHAKPKKKNCAEEIRNDWYGDGQVNKQYALHCYRDAIRGLPVDVKDYQHAEEDILRALAYRKKGKPDPGDGRSVAPSSTDTNSSVSHPPGIPPAGPGGPDGTSSVADGPGVDLDGPSSSSIPIPLLVLGGLAIVLLGAGGGGYVSRRLQARRGAKD
jgi:hypothetical protein